MDIEEKIQKQVVAGFTADEIRTNLIAEGHTQEEVNAGMKAQAASVKNAKKTSAGSIGLGILMLVVVIFRIARFSHSSGFGATLALISIVTGILVAIFYFARK